MRIDRYLTHCQRCGQRRMWAELPPDHACPALGPEARASFSAVAQVRWLPQRGNCRADEPRCIILERARPGECSRRCRGSLSPICYCPACRGTQHGIESIERPASGSGREIMDFIINRNPPGEIARRARRST